jgi:hypothetical protein
MFSLFRSQPYFVVAADDEYHDQEKTGEPARPVVWSSTLRRGTNPWLWVLMFCALIGISATATFRFTQGAAKTCPTNPQCFRPEIRREWRTLSRADRNEYIAAVQCLATLPSKVHNNGSLYDDFPRVHQVTAPTAHKAAPFLPWHRYFVHAYEAALKNQCGYTGYVPYVFCLFQVSYFLDYTLT